MNKISVQIKKEVILFLALSLIFIPWTSGAEASWRKISRQSAVASQQSNRKTILPKDISQEGNTATSSQYNFNGTKISQETATAPIGEKSYLITDFNTILESGWKYETYGTKRETANNLTFCRLTKKTYNRCGVFTDIREIDYGLGVRDMEGIAIRVINLGTREVTFSPEIFLSWFESDTNNALIAGYPAVKSVQTPILGALASGEIREIRVPWSERTWEGFDPAFDALAGISFRHLGGTEDIGIVQISLYGNATPEKAATTHRGGYMIYQRASDGERFTYATFDGTNWGEPFAGQRLQAGDRIEVYGMINAGTIVGYKHGTQTSPITLIGMTPESGFDGKGATKLGQNGGLITLYGNYWVIENLTLRNCGIPYGGAENAAAFHTTTQNTVFSNLRVFNCGHGMLFSKDSKNNLIKDSEFFNNGYFRSGQTHNLYINGQDNIVRNNRIAYSGGQNLKNRGWNTTVENNLILNAGNFDVDFAGNPDMPTNLDTTSVFRGNTVIKSNYSDNASQMFTFFEDNFSKNLTDHLIITNNTFIGPNNASLFRIGKNKTIEAYNNVVLGVEKIQYAGATDKDTGTLLGSHNWLLETSKNRGSLESSLFGNDASLQKERQVYVPMSESPIINAGNNNAPGMPILEYAWPSSSQSRFQDGQIDIGAFEYRTQTTIPPACEELWTCSDWNACVAGQMERTCVDENECGTLLQKLETEQSCIVPEPAEPACEDISVVASKTSPEDSRFGIDQSLLYETYPSFGYNSNDNALTERKRYNIHFREVASSIPQDKQLKKAELKLYFYHQYDPATIGIYPMTEPWEGNGHASWTLRQGAPDARNNMFPSPLPALAWSTPGGTVDANNAIFANITNEEQKSGLFQNVDITPIVQRWLNGETANDGLQIRAEQGSISDLFGATYWSQGQYMGPSLALTLGCKE